MSEDASGRPPPLDPGYTQDMMLDLDGCCTTHYQPLCNPPPCTDDAGSVKAATGHSVTLALCSFWQEKSSSRRFGKLHRPCVVMVQVRQRQLKVIARITACVHAVHAKCRTFTEADHHPKLEMLTQLHTSAMNAMIRRESLDSCVVCGCLGQVGSP